MSLIHPHIVHVMIMIRTSSFTVWGIFSLSDPSPHCVGDHASISWVHTAAGMSTIIHSATLEWLKVSVIITPKLSI